MSAGGTTQTTYLLETFHHQDRPNTEERRYVLLGDERQTELAREVIVAEALGGLATNTIRERHMESLMRNLSQKNGAGQVEIADVYAQEAILKTHSNEHAHNKLLDNAMFQGADGALSPREYIGRYNRLTYLFESSQITLLTASGLVAEIGGDAVASLHSSISKPTFKPKTYELTTADRREFTDTISPAATHYTFRAGIVRRGDGFLEAQPKERRRYGAYDAAGNFKLLFT